MENFASHHGHVSCSHSMCKDLLVQFISQTYLPNVSIELLFLSKKQNKTHTQKKKLLKGGKIHPEAARETRIWECCNLCLYDFTLS